MIIRDGKYPEIVIFFRLFRDNRYSVLSLISAIEQLVRFPVKIEFFSSIYDDAFRRKFSDALGSYKTTTILAYSFASPLWKAVLTEWQMLKERWDSRGSFVTVAGGPHPTGAVKYVIQGGANFVCAGEGEFAIAAFLHSLPDCSEGTIPSNFYFRRHGKLSRGFSKLQGDWRILFPFPRNPHRFAPIEITRGCPFKCKYCETPIIKGSKPRHKKIEIILDAVRCMVKYGRTDIRFITPNALGYGSQDGRIPNVSRLHDLLSSIRRLLPSHGRIFFGSFPSEVRPEFVTRDTVKIMKEFCNNKQVVIGAQSGSQRMLDIMNRGHSVEDVINACEILVDEGFRPSVDFIFGLPGEQMEDTLQSLNLIKTLVKIGARIHAHTFMPLPGSKWAGRKMEPIPGFVKGFLERLIADGKLFGQWMHQEKIGQQLSLKHEFAKEV